MARLPVKLATLVHAKVVASVSGAAMATALGERLRSEDTRLLADSWNAVTWRTI